MLATIGLDPKMEIREKSIGDSGLCVVIDNFLNKPYELIDFARSHEHDFARPAKGYPGVLMDMPDATTGEITRFFRREMSRRFGFLRGDFENSSFLSMMTLKPNELSNLQRLCHTDPRARIDRANFASVLYLFDNPALGGTAFYEWKERDAIVKATALERDNPDAALTFLRERFPTFRKAAEYMSDSNEIAELIGTVAAKFNRLIFYSGEIPHSAYVRDASLLSNDFASGRLTLNCFASVRPGGKDSRG